MSRKILVVDDEPDVLRVLQLSLEEAGYQVATAQNGRQALEGITTHKPDLILMDQMMPEMDGLEALKRIKENETTNSIPVIMLTAKDTKSDMLKGWESGTDLYLLKPVMMKDLVNYINRILE